MSVKNNLLMGAYPRSSDDRSQPLKRAAEKKSHNMSEIVSALTRELGEDAVVRSSDVSARYAADVSGENPRKPIAVVMPRSTEDVATTLRLCSEARQKIVVQGGMTGLSGGATPQGGELSLSLERLSGIESVDTDAMTMTVRAGTPLQTIQEAAEVMNPGDVCTIKKGIYRETITPKRWWTQHWPWARCSTTLPQGVGHGSTCGSVCTRARS